MCERENVFKITSILTFEEMKVLCETMTLQQVNEVKYQKWIIERWRSSFIFFSKTPLKQIDSVSFDRPILKKLKGNKKQSIADAQNNFPLKMKSILLNIKKAYNKFTKHYFYYSSKMSAHQKLNFNKKSNNENRPSNKNNRCKERLTIKWRK